MTKPSLQVFLTLCLLFMANITCTLAKDVFRVTDESVTVYAEPERINALGKIHRGEEYEATGEEGSLFVFNYKGRKAYVASYCCKKVDTSSKQATQETAAPAKQAEVVVGRKAESQAGSKAGSKEEIAQKDGQEDAAQTKKGYVTRSVGSTMPKASAQDLPDSFTNILGVLVAIGFIFGIWALFRPQSFEDFFNRLAGKRVTECSKLTHWRPLIPLVLFGLALKYFTSAAPAVIIIYEIVIIAIRTPALRSVRAAVVESIYLFTSGLGYCLLCWMYLIFAILAVGGQGGSSNPDTDKNRRNAFGRRACYNCKYWEHGRCRRHDTVVSDGGCCSDHVYM